MIAYTPLWNTMKSKNVSQYRLLKDKAIDNKTLDGIKKGRNLRLKNFAIIWNVRLMILLGLYSKLNFRILLDYLFSVNALIECSLWDN